MTTLLDVLMDAIRDAFTADDWVPGSQILAAIPPETREALSVGLLLAEVERRLPHIAYYSWLPVSKTLFVVAGPEARSEDGWNESAEKRSTGPTLHAALTALLEQLPVPEPVR